ERALLGAPISQRPCRFTFKIEDHKIGLDPQNLPEMVVPMNSNPRCLKDLRLTCFGKMLQDACAAAEHGGSNLKHFVRQIGHILLEHVEDAASMLLKTCQQDVEVLCSQRFWGERRVVGRGSQRQVQLGSSASEGYCGVEINADMIPGNLRWRLLRELHRVLHPAVHVLREGEWSARFKIPLEFFDGPLPTIAFVRYQSLEHG